MNLKHIKKYSPHLNTILTRLESRQKCQNLNRVADSICDFTVVNFKSFKESLVTQI